MLTNRAFLLTTLGLLTGFAANAQTAATGPGPTDILSWVAGALAVIVLVMGLMTGVSMASVAAASYQTDGAATPAQAENPAPMAAVAPQAPAAASAPSIEAPVLTSEPVAA
ncbi:hypothetical protein DNI29_06710 [Hymenobacter sediminis]|uniref:hypothetical protein n=1 Tax=Hymenobacter sediminis TaxID=2218621 RepID=UPI000DA66144|nr:hypothetical protein [Hymenobacter sediminis]RPD48314.1 hypothetical protein DNI29_06710 [Hymenobacter sediminis]